MVSRREQAGLPTGPEMRALVLDCLRHMVNPVNRTQIGDAVAKRRSLTPEHLAVREPASGGGDSSRSFVDWWSEWTCNDLKHIGVTEQPGPGLYQLTQEGRSISLDEVEQRNRERNRRYREQRQRARTAKEQEPGDELESEDTEATGEWQRELLDRLLGMSPSGFEHLSGALLRAAEFHDVTVTRQSGDGGIDAVAVYRPQGLISFRTTVQCKRWAGSVGPDRVQAFQGASMGKADRGILITTGYFTDAAKAQANAPGAFPIDLVDGNQLAVLLKQYELGVRTATVDITTVDHVFFDQFEDDQ